MTMACTRKGSGRLPTRCAPLGDVTVVAPIQEASAIGHALTLRRPLRIETIGPNVFAVDGTPTDCVNIAITHVLKGKPDLIVSGHQQGLESRRRRDLFGTVSGALEGALLAIPSIAVSAQRVKDESEFGPSAEAAAIVAASGARTRPAEVHAAEHQHAEGAEQGLSRRPSRPSAITSPP